MTSEIKEDLLLELKKLKQWVAVSDKEAKIPLLPNRERAANITDPADWGYYDECVGEYKGFVLTDGDAYTILDIDIKDSMTITERQVYDYYLTSKDTYVERSVNKQGLHVISKGKQYPGRKKKLFRNI